MIDKKSWLLVILVIVGLTACATLQSGVKEPPLPNDINIISPSPDLPKEIAVFSGKWKGTWSHGLDSILVVEEINDAWAQVVWSQGDLPRYDVSAKYFRFKCKVIPGPKPKLEWVFRTGPGGTISFEATDSNTLEGSMSIGGPVINKIIMKRTN